MVDIFALKALCEAHDRIDHYLHLDLPDPPTLRHHADGALVGVLTVQVGEPPEVCLLVHPDHRRRGIGRGLLERAKAELVGGAGELLLTADARSDAGRAFAAAVGASHRFSEYRMELERVPDDQAWPTLLALRPAGPDDADTFASIRAAAYGDPYNETRGRQVEAELREGRHRYYLAELDGRPIGTMRIFVHGASAAVTSFAVVRELQGRGFGRQILTRLVRQLAAEGWSSVQIEVETENRNALGLYRSCGFREVAAYDYHAIALGRRDD